MDVSIIIPVFNGEKWVNKCMESISDQDILKTNTNLEIVVYNDGSNDKTLQLLENWNEYFNNIGVKFIITGSKMCKGVGAAKNGAVKNSSGQFLCFQDIDDIMLPSRITLQLEAAKTNQSAIVGSRIIRNPPNSTPRLQHWANNLDDSQLKTQIYTSNGPTLLMPTWFCHRSVFDRIGGFDESGCGTPEDLLFLYSHLDAGGDLVKVNKELVNYTYHEGATTFCIAREKIWQIQLERIEKLVLPHWSEFTVWNAGKAGRKLVRALSYEARQKVIAFCDVDVKKIGRIIELYCPHLRKNLMSLPVFHYLDSKPPFVICVKQNLTNGDFEKNLKSLDLREGKDYILFN